IGNTVVQHLAAHAAHLDEIAHDGHDNRLFVFLALDGEHDGCLGFAAHQLDGVAQWHALDGLAVDMRDDVASHDAGTRGRRVFYWSNNLRHAVFHADLDTQPAEATLRDGFHFLECF